MAVAEQSLQKQTTTTDFLHSLIATPASGRSIKAPWCPGVSFAGLLLSFDAQRKKAARERNILVEAEENNVFWI